MSYDGKNWINMQETDFTEEKKVTEEMLKIYWNNDEYLKRQTDELWNESMPVTRKKFMPPEMDVKKSYSAVVQDDKIVFDDRLFEERQLDLEDDDDFDFDKSTTEFEDEEIICSTIKTEKPGKLHTSTRDYGPRVKFQKGHEGQEEYMTGDSFHCNAYWSISYPKNKPYVFSAKQKKNDSLKMHSVCRAQVFQAQTNGYLEDLTLMLKGGIRSGHKLIVEIVTTEKHKIKGKNIICPASRGSINKKTKFKNMKVLAKETISFKKRMQRPGMVTIKFKKRPEVIAGTYYAFVLRSPGTRFRNAYRIGGWGKNCRPYAHKGIAFMSKDNGYTWIPYGDKEERTGPSQRKREPLYFAYEFGIRERVTDTQYVKSTLYSKPFMFNRINEMGISYSENVPDGCDIKYYISKDGKKWDELKKNLVSFKDNLNDNEYNERNMVLLKAELFPSSDKKKTPSIKGLGFIAHLDLPVEAVVRTLPYHPRTSGILAAHVFGAINAPYYLSNSERDSVTVDIVKESVASTAFIIFAPEEILTYGFVDEIDKQRDALEEIVDDSEELNKYLNEHPEIIDGCIEENLYILDHIPEYGFKLDDNAAYPILNCYLKIPGEDTVNFAEWIDFTVNYSDSTLKFRDNNLLDEGNLIVSYEPIFIKNLTMKDMPFHMDYQIESFVVTSEMKEKGISYTLKCAAHNPIKSVEVLYDNIITELEENKDFFVSYVNQTLNFTAFIPESAVVTITYVCDYIEDGISLQYNMKRENTDDEIKLYKNYIEYKT